MLSFMRWTVHSLNAREGTTTLEVFLDGLSDADAAEEAEALLEMLEKHGRNLRPPISKSLSDGLFEARGTTGVRLFFVFAPGSRIIVLDGYLKKRQSMPPRIMARIRKLQKDVERALHKEEEQKHEKQIEQQVA